MGCCYSLLILILLAFAAFSDAQQGGAVGGGTMELWCVAKNNADDAALQTAIDWACGPGGANCGPIQQGGPCYNPADILTMASYAFNDYCLKKGLTQDSCYFDNTAALTSLNPSRGSCKFPSSSSVAGGNATTSAAGVGDMSCSTSISSRWKWSVIVMTLLYAFCAHTLRLGSLH